jgi:uncharacterized cupin superfamily protein
MGWSRVNVHDLRGEGPGGAVRFVRRALGVEAFGLSWIELPPDVVGREHDERGTDQEEVSVVVRGGGSFRIDGEVVDVREGDVLRFDPETTRCPVAGSDGMTLLAIGARQGSYEPRGPF